MYYYESNPSSWGAVTGCTKLNVVCCASGLIAWGLLYPVLWKSIIWEECCGLKGHKGKQTTKGRGTERTCLPGLALHLWERTDNRQRRSTQQTWKGWAELRVWSIHVVLCVIMYVCRKVLCNNWCYCHSWMKGWYINVSLLIIWLFGHRWWIRMMNNGAHTCDLIVCILSGRCNWHY